MLPLLPLVLVAAKASTVYSGPSVDTFAWVLTSIGIAIMTGIPASLAAFAAWRTHKSTGTSNGHGTVTQMLEKSLMWQADHAESDRESFDELRQRSEADASARTELADKLRRQTDADASARADLAESVAQLKTMVETLAVPTPSPTTEGTPT